MSTEVIVALISTGGALLTAIIVEAIRRSRAQRATDERLDAVIGQLHPNGGSSVADAVTRIESTVGDVQRAQAQHGERLAAVEARVADHIAVHSVRS